jgi:hypothetical protein
MPSKGLLSDAALKMLEQPQQSPVAAAKMN